MTTRPIFEPTYTSRDVEALAGVSQIVQRDWRRRDILVGGTEGRPGRWAYNLAEITSIAVMATISGKLGNLRGAFLLSALAAQAIFYKLTGYTTVPMKEDLKEAKYACLWEYDRPNAKGMGAGICDDIEEAFSSADGPALFVLDINRVILSLRSELVELIKAEFERAVAEEGGD